MNLSHYDFDTVFTVIPDVVNVLTIEDEKKFFEYCNELYVQISTGKGNFCLSQGEKVYSLAKYSIMINDLFNLQLNERKTITKLYQALQQEVDMKFNEEYYKVRQCFQLLIEKINAESNYSVEFDDEESFTDLLKAFGVKLSEENSTLESLVSRLKFLAEFLNIKCFFFVNLKTFFSPQQLQELYHEAQLEDINIFLLENTVKDKLQGEVITVLDKDLCEINI